MQRYELKILPFPVPLSGLLTPQQSMRASSSSVNAPEMFPAVNSLPVNLAFHNQNASPIPLPNIHQHPSQSLFHQPQPLDLSNAHSRSHSNSQSPNSPMAHGVHGPLRSPNVAVLPRAGSFISMEVLGTEQQVEVIPSEERVLGPHLADTQVEHPGQVQLSQIIHSVGDSRRYVCAECGLATGRQRFLLLHEIVHHRFSFTVYFCPICDYASRWRSKVYRHIGTLHRGDIEHLGGIPAGSDETLSTETLANIIPVASAPPSQVREEFARLDYDLEKLLRWSKELEPSANHSPEKNIQSNATKITASKLSPKISQTQKNRPSTSTNFHSTLGLSQVPLLPPSFLVHLPSSFKVNTAQFTESPQVPSPFILTSNSTPYQELNFASNYSNDHHQMSRNEFESDNGDEAACAERSSGNSTPLNFAGFSAGSNKRKAKIPRRVFNSVTSANQDISIPPRQIESITTNSFAGHDGLKIGDQDGIQIEGENAPEDGEITDLPFNLLNTPFTINMTTPEQPPSNSFSDLGIVSIQPRPTQPTMSHYATPQTQSNLGVTVQQEIWNPDPISALHQNMQSIAPLPNATSSNKSIQNRPRMTRFRCAVCNYAGSCRSELLRHGRLHVEIKVIFKSNKNNFLILTYNETFKLDNIN